MVAKKHVRFFGVILVGVIGLFLGCNNGNTPNDYIPETGGTVNEVNIVYLRATFPVVHFALNSFDLSRVPTFVNIERRNTLNWERLPANVLPIPGTMGGGFWTDHVATTASFIRNLYLNDKTTRFNLFLCDFGFIVYFMINNGIPATNFTVTAWMDGTGSINIPAQRYAGANALEIFDADMEAVRYAFKIAVAGGDWLASLDIGDLRTGAQLQRYSLAMVKLFDNITWEVGSITTLENTIPQLRDVIRDLANQGRIVERNIQNMVQGIHTRGKATDLEWLLNLRWGYADADSMGGLLDRGNNKDTLMILGTHTHTEDALIYTYPPGITWGWINGVNQVGLRLIGTGGLMERVIARYGESFNIFYKGHPGTPTDGEKQEWLDLHDIIDIPAAIPSETIMFLYDNVFIGGYPGSTFLSAINGQTIVSFGTPALFDVILQGANLPYFANTEFMYMNPDGDFVVRRRNN